MIKVFDNNGKKYEISENKEISRGGEGRIVSLDNGYVAKLYFSKNSCLDDKKIYELSQLNDSLFIKPLFSLKGDYNGYIMRELNTNEYFPLYSLYTPNFAIKHALPQNYKKFVANKLIEAVKNAHDNHIVIGDLNPFNILVNDMLDVKFIDVDSFETPSFKHNGKLLEDIRDYAYNGAVSENSDYFALAVILFNLFTYMHPYKGIHNKYGNKLTDRMINKCSIISNEANNIKIPKFYQPVSDSNILKDFSSIFNDGKRFLISLNSRKIDAVKLNGVIISDSLIITDILSGEKIIKVHSSNTFMAIVCDGKTIVYKTPSKGILVKLFTVDNNVRVFLTDKYVYGYKDGKLKKYDENENKFIEIEQINIKKLYLVEQVKNILLIVTEEDLLYKVYLDDTYGNYVKFNVLNVYYKSFKLSEGIYQHFGENNYIVYNNKNDITFINNGKDDIQVLTSENDCGIISHKNGSEVLTYMYSINSYGEITKKDFPTHCQITSNDIFVIAYYEDKLRFIAKDTLVEAASFAADGLDGYSFSINKSGIFAYNGNVLKMLNTK